MSDRFEIKITGSNQASSVFKQVTNDAAQMGNTVEQSGQRAGRSLQDLDRKAAAIGASIGAATMILGEFSRAAAEDEAGQARLQQSIENTGKSYDEYSLAVDKAIKAGQEKAFSDDATREALVRLNAVTNDTGQSLDQLSLAMDFARAKGISLSDSAGIIAKVYGGNLGILTRYGIVLEEGETATEALAKIQQISAGQAETYASTQAGQIDILKDKWGELSESIGASTGSLQQLLMLAPGLSTMGTALSGLLGGIGGGAALGGVGLLAANAAAIYLLIDALNGSPRAGGDNADYVFGNVGVTGANLAKKLSPGSFGDSLFDSYATSWQGRLDENAIESIFAQMFFGVQDTKDVAKIVSDIVARGGFKGFDGFGSISSLASTNFMTTGQYVDQQATAAGYVFDPNTQSYLSPSQQVAKRFRDNGGYGSVGAGLSYTPPVQYTGPYQSNGGLTGTPRYYGDIEKGPTGRAIGGSSVNDMSDYRSGPADSATYSADASNGALQAQTAAVQKLYSAYSGLFDGITSVNDVTSAYKTVQDGLIQEQGVYSQQISEYTSQVNAVEAAHEVLNKRVAEGGTLTKEQQEFQDNYTKALERGNGAVDDAVVAQGMLAEQYLLNMEKGDAMNRALGDSATATSELVGVISELILSMDNVPTEVKTQILLNGADDSIEGLIRYYNWLSSLPGHVTTVIETQYTVTGSDGSTRDRGSGSSRLGGVVGYRNGGIPVELAEAGPELLHFRNGGSAWAMNRGIYNVPRGTYVDTAPASRLKAGGGGGMTIHINAPFTVVANDPRDFGNALHEFALGSSRS